MSETKPTLRLASPSREPCVIPGCTSWRSGRGLCKKHHQMMTARVKHGETSWEEAETLGLCLPKLDKSTQDAKNLDKLIAERREKLQREQDEQQHA